jgi:hypothetical protein
VATISAQPRSGPLRLDTRRRRVQLVWLLAGVLLIAGSALAFGVVAQRLADRHPVVVLGRPLARGSVVTAADLAVAHVAADPGVALVPADQSRQLVGHVLLASLPAGSLLTTDLVGSTGLAVTPASRTIGLELEPGGYPTPALAAGDRVSVVLTSGSGTVLTDDAMVLDASPAIEGGSSLLVSVVVDAESAPRVAAAAAQGQARLLLHGAVR